MEEYRGYFIDERRAYAYQADQLSASYATRDEVHVFEDEDMTMRLQVFDSIESAKSWIDRQPRRVNPKHVMHIQINPTWGTGTWDDVADWSRDNEEQMKVAIKDGLKSMGYGGVVHVMVSY